MLEMRTEGARGAVGGEAAAASEPEAEAAIASDFETFLKMLTAQLEHQDPLNPLDSNDFAVQLATFSGVEQQVRTNELLAELTQAQDGGSHAGWIGLDALTAGPARFEGAPLALEFEPRGEAAGATLVVADAAGREVGRHSVDPAAGRATWAGTDASGAPLPSGRYEFQLLAASGDGTTEAVPVLSYARVSEIRPGPEGTRVVLRGGAEVPAEEVRALRAPGGEGREAFP